MASNKNNPRLSGGSLSVDQKLIISKKLIDNLLTDLRQLSSESRRKYGPVKDAAESGMLKLRTISTKPEEIPANLSKHNAEILQPLVLGCDTKNTKLVQLSLQAIQRLISHEVLSKGGATSVISTLWSLMESGIEELKLLQTTILLLTTNSIVQHEALSKAIVLCFRLHFAKDNTTINTAAATVRQLVSCVFERAVTEDRAFTDHDDALATTTTCEQLKSFGKQPPPTLRPCAQDAFMLFQDLCQLVNADQPHWLHGINEMTRTFGLELMESVLTAFPEIFRRHSEFSFLVKEQVCPLVIKLFSPSLKYRQGLPAPASPTPVEKPHFPIVMRLLRMVAVLVRSYYSLLVTECEIFLSLLVKFLDCDKPMWQRALALEVLHLFCASAAHLRSFCISYDMKPHSTKIFRDIVNALGAFIQSLFLNSTSSVGTGGNQPGARVPDTTGTPPALVAGMPVGGGVSPQPAFIYRGIWIPLMTNIPLGNSKQIYLEMIDKTEPPVISEGYGISVAFACLLDVIRAVQQIVDSVAVTTKAKPTERRNSSAHETMSTLEIDEENRPLVEELLNSSWCGVLAAMSLLLDASTDESATEAILKSEQTFASLAGRLGQNIPRDAFITALCKASLPPHYALTVLNMVAVHHPKGHQKTPSGNDFFNPDAIERSQVVAVGTALPTASSPVGAHQNPVMLTAKNIQCMRSILSVAHCHGGILGNAWHLVLTTLQHLVWILGLKPAAGGSMRASKQASDGSNAVITTAVMADLPVLSSMLSRLFESSQYLDDVALHHLIDALCKLSAESMELAYSNREPSLFAVAKLLETGLVNLPRVGVLWKPLTAHLLEVCQHPHAGMRGWGAEALTSLIKAALMHAFEPALDADPARQGMLLNPLQELSAIQHSDIRQKQLECVLQILHNNGDRLGHGWALILTVIGAVNNDQGENLIRIAFQCLQLVVTDFLPLMPSACLQSVVAVAAKFGLQNQDVNISLTAIGLMWNISDYFYQNQQQIQIDLEKDESEAAADDDKKKDGATAVGEMKPFDSLWMCLFSKLGDLCVDPRPPVRKSAGQTLFSTIGAHGSLLQQKTWQIVLWQVLFPLLDKVKKLSSSAPTTKVESGQVNILIHHSRDTAEKQWAETQVLTLAGVARVFNAKRFILEQLGDFPRAWALLLEFIEASALCRNAEVTLAALKSFQEILQINRSSGGSSSGNDTDTRRNSRAATGGATGTDLAAPSEEKMFRSLQDMISTKNDDIKIDSVQLWSNAWRVWLSIGGKVTLPPDSKSSTDIYVPSQPFLTALIQIFPPLFEHIKHRFVAADLQKLSAVLKGALSAPVQGDASPFILPAINETNVTALQEAVLNAVDVLQNAVMNGPESMQSMYPELFNQLLTFAEYAVKSPKYGIIDAKSINAVRGPSVDYVLMNFVPFAEKSLNLVIAMYERTARHPAVIHDHVMQDIITTLRVPLAMKYGCMSQTTWNLAVTVLFQTLTIGLPVARKHRAAFDGMWTELASAIEEFLFSGNPPPPTMTVEDCQRDENIDCRLVRVIGEDILPHAGNTPREFVEMIMNILNRGSIHSATSESFIDADSSKKLREEFAKTCFETLLKFSFITNNSSSSPEGSITKLAVNSLLKRCQDVLRKYVEDEKLSGKCPLPRPRMSEMAFVLKAIATLIQSLKKAPQKNIDKQIWYQVIDLYPYLVDCITSTSPQVCRALREALHEYKDLMQPGKFEIQNGR
ncbi:protein MON2 homolog [Tubulanus polymorphus]|uniref:protein MON2 homolog n=1 Tax=Tubulanus polymorphus TaxID=672921 RepID=UPI003DA5529D